MGLDKHGNSGLCLYLEVCGAEWVRVYDKGREEQNIRMA